MIYPKLYATNKNVQINRSSAMRTNLNMKILLAHLWYRYYNMFLYILTYIIYILFWHSKNGFYSVSDEQEKYYYISFSYLVFYWRIRVLKYIHWIKIERSEKTHVNQQMKTNIHNKLSRTHEVAKNKCGC